VTVTRDVAATRQRVWDVLANGWTYSGWVVGNSRIRAVSSNWPAPGARILHSIGTWPAVINDETVVESCITGEELVLRAKSGQRPRRGSPCSSATLPADAARHERGRRVGAAALGTRQRATDRSSTPLTANARGG
jgi:hypothetical protein